MKKNKSSVNIITLGCSKNIVDSEVIMRQLAESNFELKFDSNQNSEIIIINTCGFINDAKQESIDTILECVNAKKNGSAKKVFVTGCLSERYKSELQKEIPEIDGFFGVAELPSLLKSLGAKYKSELLGERLLTTPKHYAYFKVSEGCDRKCSFCAIPLIRGKHVSRPIDSLVKEAEYLSSIGVKEIILIAQDLTYYGIDIYKKNALAELLEKLAKLEKFPWIRLHYAYPTNFPLEVLDVMKEYSSICKYIDIPFQHISDRILQSMQRGHSQKDIYKLIDNFRNRIEDIAIRTSLIVGYPGETSKEFKELIEFVNKAQFDRLGVFKYSPEENTKAFALKDSVSAATKNTRFEDLMQIQQKISLNKNEAKIGKTFKVIIDKLEGDYYIGRTEFDSPEVDNEVLIKAKKEKLEIGNFYNVKINAAEEFDLFGEIAK